MGEGEPYLLYLVLTEKAVDYLDVRAQEGYILHSLPMGLHGTRPHTRTLDVYSDEVHLGEHLRQPDGIFTLATSQFQDYWVLIMEDFGVPCT